MKQAPAEVRTRRVSQAPPLLRAGRHSSSQNGEMPLALGVHGPLPGALWSANKVPSDRAAWSSCTPDRHLRAWWSDRLIRRHIPAKLEERHMGVDRSLVGGKTNGGVICR